MLFQFDTFVYEKLLKNMQESLKVVVEEVQTARG
jgi:hypothetical protein